MPASFRGLLRNTCKRLRFRFARKTLPTMRASRFARVRGGWLVLVPNQFRERSFVLNIGRRVFTIVFPRTLKHYVLLHAIFGHEIGHAAGTIPQHKAELRDKVLGPLRNTGPLEHLPSKAVAEKLLRACCNPGAAESIQ